MITYVNLKSLILGVSIKAIIIFGIASGCLLIIVGKKSIKWEIKKLIARIPKNKK
jgi:hypothetical protein